LQEALVVLAHDRLNLQQQQQQQQQQHGLLELLFGANMQRFPAWRCPMLS
jgi:hypothetical protein